MRTDVELQAWLDQEDAHISACIRRFGWAIQYVGGPHCSFPGCEGTRPEDATGPPFAYTVGLFGMGHPELLVIGLPMDTTGPVLNDLGERIRAGADLVPAELIAFPDWPHRIVPEIVPNPGDIVYSANRHYQRPPEHSVPVLQLSYDDVHGRFPWDPGYVAPEMQPRPGTFHA
jgi:hypothetical protein